MTTSPLADTTNGDYTEMMDAGRFRDREAVAVPLQAPRYAVRSFPPYRFIPGRDPHPTAHPQGHSYHPPGTPHPALEPVPESQWNRSEDYLYGCDLYNHAYWWEAHEAWEGIWRTAPAGGRQHVFLQGLIQASACHLKLFVAHLDGVRRLRESSLGYLRRALGVEANPVYMGLALGQFIERFSAYYDRLLGQDAAAWRHDWAAYPFIRLTEPAGAAPT